MTTPATKVDEAREKLLGAIIYENWCYLVDEFENAVRDEEEKRLEEILDQLKGRTLVGYDLDEGTLISVSAKEVPA